MSSRRVVVTGVGALCALGNDAPSIWAAAQEGRSGVTRTTHFDPKNLSCQIASEVHGFDFDEYFGRNRKKLDPCTQFGVVASDEAVRDAGIEFDKCNADRCGVIVGSGIGGLYSIEKNHLVMLDKGARRVTPHFIPMLMVNALAGQISIRHGLKGPNYV
ncbi:MAG: hypothetical protein OER88_15020, partial [Planctomycetota bacterium]|nr:hypothetical protein [Planctomycetota bacterium]